MTPPAAADPFPRLAPSATELDDLAVLLAGGYGSVTGFLGPEDLHAVDVSAALADGRPCPVPVALRASPEDARTAARAGCAILVDEEGAAAGVVDVERVWEIDDLAWGIAGPVRTPDEPARSTTPPSVPVLAEPSPPERLLAVPFDRALHAPVVAAVAALAADRDARVVLLPLTGRGRPGALEPSALLRSCAGAARDLSASVRAAPLAYHGNADRDRAAQVLLARSFGASLVAMRPTCDHPAVDHPAVDDPAVVDLPDVVLDPDSRRWRVAGAGAPASSPVAADVEAQLAQAVADGLPVPPWVADADVVRELRRAHRPGGGRGFAVLLTGLSGSGKSTIARALTSTLLETTDRTVTLLDGDVVRRLLTAGLGFSRTDREQNVRRIGFVAAEIIRHGGIAICAPIAPYSAMRAEMRRMTEAAGGFLLVHVATPIEVCEARDRKGLYAQARSGAIREFTGISDPFETPVDADLVVDAAQIAVPDAVRRIIAAVSTRGWLL